VIPLRDDNPTRRTPRVTYGLIAANALLFLYEVSLEPPALELFVHRFGMIPYEITQGSHFGSFITPLTSMFLHGGWLHLIFNMWSLHIFGDNVEDDMGSVGFAAFYVLCGFAAAAAQTIIYPASEVPMVGASGAIAGVLGAYLRLYPRARVVTLIPVVFVMLVRELPAFWFILVWFAIQLLSGYLELALVHGNGDASIAFFAHIGGFVAGLLLLDVFRSRRPPSRRRRIHQGELDG
jgi:membrane associated rhomboid family serine protease